MLNFKNFSLGNKIAIISLMVAIITALFTAMQLVKPSVPLGDTQITQGNNSPTINETNGNVELNYK